jgi:hypothetical protein
MNRLFNKRLPSVLLGLSLDGNHLDGALVRRNNGSWRVEKTFSATLNLNPLSGEPELVGRELRNHLEQAGIRERACVLCLPASSVLSTQVDLPDLPEAEMASFLEITAERNFPYSPEALSMSHSVGRFGDQRHATIVAVPRTVVDQLENVLRGAQLRPVSFTLAVTELRDPGADEGSVVMLLRNEGLDLQISTGGAVASLRSLGKTAHEESRESWFDAAQIARELRITLGQFPAEARKSVSRTRLFGSDRDVERFSKEIGPLLSPLGLRVEEASSRDAAAPQPAIAAAGKILMGGKPVFEFLPPRQSQWQQLTGRFSSKKLMWAGATAGVLLLAAGIPFGVQQWQLSRLSSQWGRMQTRVTELDNTQTQIRRFRPWFDESFRTMRILRRVTETFPQDGGVSAKTLEIREPSSVTCSGTARDNQAFFKVIDQLRSTREISDLKIEQIRGKAPMQFTFNFQWQEGGGGGR